MASQGKEGAATTEQLAALQELIAAARHAGADAADAMLVTGASLSVQRRLGATEQVERSEAYELGLRVFVGKRQASVATGDRRPEVFGPLIERAIAMARAVPEDPFGALPDANAAAPDAAGPDAMALDLADTVEPSAEALAERAAAAEEAARAVPGITNSEGADASWGRHEVALALSTGFAGHFARTSHSVSVTVLAGSGTAMERDYDHSSATHLADLETPEAVGRRAGEQTVARLNPRRPRTARLPVIYAPRVAASLLGHLAGAITGAAIARGTSFLRESMGRQILAPGLVVMDDPLRPRGLRSRPFDGEGVAGQPLALVRDGVLQSWLLDSRSARQLGLAREGFVSTGHASRSPGGVPSPAPTNLWLAAGTQSPAALMADITEGLYITDLIGMGVNTITGDYSRGAAGFMIRNGQLAEAVSEFTIAGHLQEMFLSLNPASDLDFKRGTNAPTLRVEGLTLAGA